MYFFLLILALTVPQEAPTARVNREEQQKM